MDVNVKTARKFNKKCGILMAKINNGKYLQSKFYEIDILEIGGYIHLLNVLKSKYLNMIFMSNENKVSS